MCSGGPPLRARKPIAPRVGAGGAGAAVATATALGRVGRTWCGSNDSETEESLLQPESFGASGASFFLDVRELSWI